MAPPDPSWATLGTCPLCDAVSEMWSSLWLSEQPLAGQRMLLMILPVSGWEILGCLGRAGGSSGASRTLRRDAVAAWGALHLLPGPPREGQAKAGGSARLPKAAARGSKAGDRDGGAEAGEQPPLDGNGGAAAARTHQWPWWR